MINLALLSRTSDAVKSKACDQPRKIDDYLANCELKVNEGDLKHAYIHDITDRLDNGEMLKTQSLSSDDREVIFDEDISIRNKTNRSSPTPIALDSRGPALLRADSHIDTKAHAGDATTIHSNTRGSSSWLHSSLATSVKDMSTSISSFLWEEYRFPRSKNKAVAESTKECDVSVGKLSIYLIDAYRTDVTDAADGDYFATCAIVDTSGTVSFNGVLQEEDTNMIYNNAAPVFNSKFEFNVPHFRCGVKFSLIEGGSGRKVGTSYISIYSLIQVFLFISVISDSPNNMRNNV